ncbi:Protein-export membrane protein SecG [Buchnera aphidicola (Phyllaphis fagi)]|uniref:preprotein translocase subunit SecG n=1 Tax=Buchnera aphidicola TaxID=9 RepID=UPI003464B9DF
MYHITLVVFVIISLCLVILIMLNPIKNNSFYSSNHNNNDMTFLDSISYSTMLDRMTKIFVIIFLFLSVVICNLNTHNVIVN